MLQVRSNRDVLRLTIIITLIAVAVPLAVVAVALWGLPLHVKLPILAIAGLIPLGIAAPVSWLALSIIRNLFLRFDHIASAQAA